MIWNGWYTFLHPDVIKLSYIFLILHANSDSYRSLWNKSTLREEAKSKNMLHSDTYSTRNSGNCNTKFCSYSTTNKMHLLSRIIYSCKTLYMFQMVFPSIIRSSKLRIQQRYMSNSCYMQFRAPDDGQKDRPKHVERFTRINNSR